MNPSEHRRLTERWRLEKMATEDLQAELDLVLENVASAGFALKVLAEADDVDEFDDAMHACADIEAAAPSQGWRIVWTQKAEEGIGRTLHNLLKVSEADATNAYWFSAARFSERVAHDPDYSDPTPVDQVNIGWLLATGPTDLAMDTLLGIAIEAIGDLSQKSKS